MCRNVLWALRDDDMRHIWPAEPSMPAFLAALAHSRALKAVLVSMPACQPAAITTGCTAAAWLPPLCPEHSTQGVTSCSFCHPPPPHPFCRLMLAQLPPYFRNSSLTLCCCPRWEADEDPSSSSEHRVPHVASGRSHPPASRPALDMPHKFQAPAPPPPAEPQLLGDAPPARCARCALRPPGQGPLRAPRAPI